MGWISREVMSVQAKKLLFDFDELLGQKGRLNKTNRVENDKKKAEELEWDLRRADAKAKLPKEPNKKSEKGGPVFVRKYLDEFEKLWDKEVLVADGQVRYPDHDLPPFGEEVEGAQQVGEKAQVARAAQVVGDTNAPAKPVVGDTNAPAKAQATQQALPKNGTQKPIAAAPTAEPSYGTLFLICSHLRPKFYTPQKRYEKKAKRHLRSGSDKAAKQRVLNVFHSLDRTKLKMRFQQVAAFRVLMAKCKDVEARALRTLELRDKKNKLGLHIQHVLGSCVQQTKNGEEMVERLYQSALLVVYARDVARMREDLEWLEESMREVQKPENYQKINNPECLEKLDSVANIIAMIRSCQDKQSQHLNDEHKEELDDLAERCLEEVKKKGTGDANDLDLIISEVEQVLKDITDEWQKKWWGRVLSTLKGFSKPL